MFSSAELIEALILRGRARLWFRPDDDRPPGEFPAGWKAWFAMMTQRVGAITGASPDAIVAIFLQRTLAARPLRVGALNRWQSFATLWRQQWQPPEREDRRLRMLAYAITLVVHLLLSVILLWLAYVRFTGVRPAPEGEAVVQVEYIGEGTPEEPGGGPPTGDIRKPVATGSAAASSASDTAAPPAPATPIPAQPVAAAQPSAPVPPREPAPPAAQPLQVTEVPMPDTRFILPPPTVRVVELPQPMIAVPELRLPTREIKVVDVPAPVPVRPIERALPQAKITIPRLDRPALEVAVRELPKPLPQMQPRALPQRVLATPQLRAPVPQVAVREIPVPASSPATRPGIIAATTPSNSAAAATSAATASGNIPTSNAPAPGGLPSARSGKQAAAPAAGSGPAATPVPGARPTQQRGDDWGASTRNRPGGNTGRSPGLFNADGSPRLPPGTAAPGGGLPPGTVEQRIADLDRAGTWLKRPPVDYTPTRFDKFWRPHETLLEEWVRKGIKIVTIPIPGSSKKLTCGVSLLQLGGGCSISDPNLNDQEAIARPPPDIPFKPELQEDQESLRRPANNP